MALTKYFSQTMGSIQLVRSFILILAVLSYQVSYAADVPQKRSAECTTCHVAWMKDFQGGKKTLIPNIIEANEPTGMQDPTSTRRMCFTCHDGFVNDSRYQFKEKGHDHPIGIKPSKKIKIPFKDGKEVYPMNKDGNVYCGTCHTAHGTDWNKHRSAIFMRTNNVNSSMCKDCHPKHADENKVNHPMPDRLENIPLVLLEKNSRFGVGRKVICQTCHRSHAGNTKKLLVMETENNSQFCVTCHDDKKELLGSGHDLTKTKGNIKNTKGQRIKTGGACSACHVSHGGDEKALYAMSLSGTKDPLTAQCLTCHRSKGIANKTDLGHYTHPVNVKVSDLGIQVNNKKWSRKGSKSLLKTLPLYDDNGLSVDGNGSISCQTCHDPHKGAKHAKTEKDKFLRISQGSRSNLCINCHAKQAGILDSKHNINLYKGKKRQKMKSKGQKDHGVCATCHNAHNGKGESMVSRSQKNKKGKTTAMNALCLDCHTKGGAASETTTGRHSHAVGVKLKKGMKAGNLPLFNKSGKRIKSHSAGMVDCVTCHNVHQWDADNRHNKQGRNLKKSGNEDNSFLRKKASGSSELCVTCHKDEALVLGTDHDMRVTNKKSKNSKKQTVGQSGVCGQCHGAHNSSTSATLWSRSRGNAKDVQSSYCRSCHTEDGVAGKKAVEKGEHPENVLVWSSRVRSLSGRKTGADMPVHSKSGHRTGAGMVTCLSCHNPHQWQASRKKAGSGKPVEGSIINSFLRTNNTRNTVCSDCHGLDGLFRYQYYHAESSRIKHPLFKE